VARPLSLSSTARKAFDRMAADSVRVLGDRFEALVAYDANRAVIFATRVVGADLAALAPLVEVWHREGLRTPLVMTPDEFARSLDAFPLEYQAMADRHVLIAGRNPFGTLQIAPADLRRACEVQAKAHLIHLRQGWLEAGGESHALAALVIESSEPWRVLIENVARLCEIDTGDRARLGAWIGSVTGMTPDLCQALLDLGPRDDAAAARLASRLPEYVTGASQLWATIDSWRA
jgi:hypothetical protein